MQGTNAHAIVSSSGAPSDRGLPKPSAWKHQKFWHCETPHAMLERSITSPASGRVVLQVFLQRPRLAYLKDNMVSPAALLCNKCKYEEFCSLNAERRMLAKLLQCVPNFLDISGVKEEQFSDLHYQLLKATAKQLDKIRTGCCKPSMANWQ